MNVHIQNIGIIENANIKVKGLTVIGGYNDTGKSTIGKIIFAITNAIKSHRFQAMSKAWLQYRYILDIEAFTNEEINKIKSDIHKVTQHSHKKRFAQLESKFEILKNRTKSSFSLNDDIFRNEKNDLFMNILSLALDYVNDEYNSELSSSLQNVFNREFDMSINNIITKKSGLIQVLVNLNDPNTDLFRLCDIKFKNNVCSIDLNTNIIEGNSLYLYEYNDCSYLETPYILQYSAMHDEYLRLKNLELNKSDFKSSYLPLHTEDLLQKIKISENKGNSQAHDIDEISDKIHEFINGKISYDQNKGDFFYHKEFLNETISIANKNTASGIKALGIVDQLINSKLIKKDSIIVFDEPENHLHPEWQIRLAEIIVEYVNAGVKIIVSSHSPYMIQALQKYSSEKIEDSDKTSFYLTSKKESGLVDIIDVTNSYDDLFELLNEPFRKIL